MEKNATGISRQTLRSNSKMGSPAVDRPAHFADATPMASHHWTGLEGWDVYSNGGRWASSQDLASEQLGDQLSQIVAEYGETVGGLLIQGHLRPTLPHLVMLAGQSALEERITLDNATWLMSCGEPSRRSQFAWIKQHDFLEDNTYRVVPLPSRSSVPPGRQQRTDLMVAQLVGVQA